MDDVELSVEGEMAFVQLRRPAVGNALRGATFDALRRIGLKLADSPPKYVILTAEGEDFCVGLDQDPTDGLYSLFEPTVRSRDGQRAAEIVTRLRSSLEGLGRLPCPVIAAIEGRCHGVGLELALVADLRVAGSTASFRCGEGQRGIVAGLGGLTRLAVSAGPARTLELALTQRVITAGQLEQMGLLSRTVPTRGSLSAAVDLAQELKRLGPSARQQTLLSLRAIYNRFEKDLAAFETEGAARTWMSGEFLTLSPAARGTTTG